METYKWKSTVCAPADLGLIYVDEDPWVAERATASVAGYSTVVRPTNGLLVDELDRSIWARLYDLMSAYESPLHNPTLSSTVVSVSSIMSAPRDFDIPDPP